MVYQVVKIGIPKCSFFRIPKIFMFTSGNDEISFPVYLNFLKPLL